MVQQTDGRQMERWKRKYESQQCKSTTTASHIFQEVKDNKKSRKAKTNEKHIAHAWNPFVTPDSTINRFYQERSGSEQSEAIVYFTARRFLVNYGVLPSAVTNL